MYATPKEVTNMFSRVNKNCCRKVWALVSVIPNPITKLARFLSRSGRRIACFCLLFNCAARLTTTCSLKLGSQFPVGLWAVQSSERLKDLFGLSPLAQISKPVSRADMERKLLLWLPQLNSPKLVASQVLLI